MILLLIIILLVIWLIIKVRRQAEYYKVEGLKLSWTNKTNIEGNVTKWIFVLKDKTGNEIHRYENSDAENLKDWTAVSVDVIGKKEFDEKIIGDNTLDIYYNNVEEGKKLYTTTVNYSESDFSGSIDTTNLEEVQEVKPAFSYEFIMNKKNQTLGIHVEYIKLDGVLATKEQTTIHKPPNRNNKPDNMFSIGSGTENYAAWNADGHNVGDKIFTIESYKQIEKIDIAYTRPRYGPGWIIKENGVTKITETSNRGNDTDPRPVVYTYNIKDGTASLPPPQPEAVAVSETQRPNPISLLVAGPDACKDKATDVVWTGTCNLGNLTGVTAFDLSRNNQILNVNYNKKLPKNYTIIYVWKPRNSDSGWRTLHRGDADHWAIVKDGGKELGMYSNRDGGFRGTGYNITPDKWQFLVVTGEGTSDTSSKGTSTFYVDLYDGKGVQKVGKADRVACGTKFQQIGWAGQEPGYLAAALVLDDILPKSEMEKVSEEAKRHFLRNEGKETPIKSIPHQKDGGADGWCNHANAVHQDVPGCGRICSDSNTVGRKDKGTWGSWDAYPGSVECPAAKLDQVWKMEGNSRKLAIGKYSERSLSLRAGNSGAQADGGGQVYYLDRHNIECGTDGLNGFGLIRQPGGKTQYNFLCLKPMDMGTHVKRTNSQYKGSKSGKSSSALYLDRHEPNCGDKPITQFRLHRDGSRRIYYKYKCGDVPAKSCRNTSTPWNQESSNVHYLDRHYAKCNPDEYITKFKLNRRGNGQFRYDFRCCKKS